MQHPAENTRPGNAPTQQGGLSLKTDGGKTKSNAIEIPSISLPKGGGAIKGIDEKFSVNAVNGTSAFSIPLPVSQARGVTPALSLSYNSGAGNGIFGLGWSLSLPSIKRKTDKQLPQYLDHIDSDVFLFPEAEDLVPAFEKKGIEGTKQKEFVIDNKGHYKIEEAERTISGGTYVIRQYRPRIEGLFSRIERWTAKNGSEIKWRVITRDNITTLFGWSAAARIADGDRIYEWLPEFVFDDKGNCCKYVYKKEDIVKLDHSAVHNRNRIKKLGADDTITYTNLYPEKIFYGNKTPNEGLANALRNGDDFFDDFLFEIMFDYSTPDNDHPDTVNNGNWSFRPDAFSDYKAGFEIRTTRLCNRVLLFHHFKGENEYDGLVRSLNLEYDKAIEDFTFLKEASMHGYIKSDDGSYTEKKLPPMAFEYQKHEWNSEIKTVSQEALVHAPAGIEQAPYQFVDLYNEGLSGILSEQANGWYYKHNLGMRSIGVGDDKALSFEQAKLVSSKPSFAGLGGQLQLADLDADGGKQLVSYSNDPTGYFELNDDNEWENFRNFPALPNIDFSDPNTRMLDLNGDGRAELVISEDNVFTWYPAEGRKGFAPAEKTYKPFEEETGPAPGVFGNNANHFPGRHDRQRYDGYCAYPQRGSLLLA